MFSEGAVSDRTWTRWFEKFEIENFELFDKPRAGRPSLIDNGIIR